MSEAPLSPRRQAQILIPFAIVTLIWGSTWIVIRSQLTGISPSWSVTYRFLAGAITMMAYAAIRGLPLRITGRDLMLAGVIGLAQFSLNFNFVYRSELYITSGLTAVVYALLIVPNSLMAWLFFRQGVSRPFLMGSGVAIIGILLLFLNEVHVSELSGGKVILGVAFALLGLLSASIANVMQILPRAKALPMPVLVAWSMVTGSVINAAYAWTIAGPPRFDPSPIYVTGVLYLGVFASAIAFTLYYELIRAIGPARAAYSNVLIPVIAMSISTVFEGYRWTWEAALGGAFAMAGLLVALRARNPAR